jgi:hypothetical protein
MCFVLMLHTCDMIQASVIEEVNESNESSKNARRAL